MRKLFVIVLFMAALLSVTVFCSAAETPQICVSGVEITAKNAADILGVGAVAYDAATGTLTLTDAAITAENLPYGIYAEGDLTIHLVGENTLTVSGEAPDCKELTGIFVGGQLTVTGDGSLYVSVSGNPAETVYGIHTGDLTQLFCSYLSVCVEETTAATAYGIKVDNSGMLLDMAERYYICVEGAAEYTCGMDVNGNIVLYSDVYVTDGYAWTENGCGVHADMIYIIDCWFESFFRTAFIADTGIDPSDGIYVWGQAEAFTSGTPVTLTLNEEHPESVTFGWYDYGVGVGGVNVTSLNKHNVLGDGTVSYDRKTNTLTLNNAHIEGSIDAYDGVNIILKGENSLTSIVPDHELAIYGSAISMLSGSGSIYGPGSLDIYLYGNNTQELYAVYLAGNNTIRDCEINITVAGENNYDAKGILNAGAPLTIESSKINVDMSGCTGNNTGIRSYQELSAYNSDISVLGADKAYEVSGGVITLGYNLAVSGSKEPFVNCSMDTLTPENPNEPVVIAPYQTPTSGTCGDSATWVYQDGTLTINGTGIVDFTGDWIPYMSTTTSIVVEEGINELGTGCFSYFSNLTDISLPDSLYVIGAQTFQGCDKLTQITIPKNVVSFDSPPLISSAADVFSGDGLTAIHVAEENPRFYSIDGVLFDQEEKALLCYPQSKLGTTYTVPDGIEVISEKAFQLCPLETVILPGSLKTIDCGAFWSANICSINIPVGVETINSEAFKNCMQLAEICVPTSVTKILDGAFANCENLDKVTILNADCRIAQIGNVFDRDTLICGAAGSTAEAHAKQYGRNFVDIYTGEEGDYYTDNAGYVALLPKNPGNNSYICCSSYSQASATGDIVGYYPNQIIVRDKTDPTYLDMLNFVQQLTKDCGTEYEKAEAIFQWIIETIPYRNDYISVGDTLEDIYALWNNLYSTRSGNLQLNSFLLSLADIPTATVSGYAHSWTAALVDGRWIMIDIENFLFDEDPNKMDEIHQIYLGVNGNLMCVIDDTTGPKLTGFGESRFLTHLETELTIPDYINFFYDTAFLRDLESTPVIHGIKGSHAEQYIRNHLPVYNCITYSDDTFTAEVRENNIPPEPVLTATGHTLSFENSIHVNFYYTVENPESITEQGMLVFYTDPGEADFAKADEVQKAQYVASSDSYMASSYGIAAKEMGDDHYYCAYAKSTDGTYVYSDLHSYSPRQYAMNRLERSDDEDLKALCVALLNYGAAAQEYFGYRTDDLMNAGLTDAQKALVRAYDPSLFTGAVAADSPLMKEYTSTGTGFSHKSASVSFRGNIAINYYFMPTEEVQSTMLFYGFRTRDLTIPGITIATGMEPQENGSYYQCFDIIAPKELDDTFYVVAMYYDAKGNYHCTGLIPYSISQYCMNTANSPTMGNLSQATAMYGYYAKEYFCK